MQAIKDAIAVLVVILILTSVRISPAPAPEPDAPVAAGPERPALVAPALDEPVPAPHLDLRSLDRVTADPRRTVTTIRLLDLPG